jgi:acyl carrier protein
MSIHLDAAQPRHVSRAAVLAEVRQVVGELMDRKPEDLQEHTRLEADLGCDSLDMVEIAMEVEEHFDISVPDDVSERAQTVGQIVDGVLQFLGEQSPAPGGA